MVTHPFGHHTWSCLTLAFKCEYSGSAPLTPLVSLHHHHQKQWTTRAREPNPRLTHWLQKPSLVRKGTSGAGSVRQRTDTAASGLESWCRSSAVQTPSCSAQMMQWRHEDVLKQTALSFGRIFYALCYIKMFWNKQPCHSEKNIHSLCYLALLNSQSKHKLQG